MTDEKLEALLDKATEAEVDSKRHAMEDAVLASMACGAWDAADFAQAVARITWSRADRRAIADALVACIQEGLSSADAIVVADKLRKAHADVKPEILDAVLNPDKALSRDVFMEYVKIMAARDKRREALAFGHQYLKKVEETGDGPGAYAELVGKVFDLGKDTGLAKDHPSERIAAAGFLEALSARRTDGREFLGLDCGFQHINEVLNGLPDGVTILAGPPSCGKTTLAKQIADYVAQYERVPVLFYSFEQSAEELRIKSLSRLASVDSRDIWKGRTGSTPWGQVEDAARDYLAGPGPYLSIIEGDRADTVDAIRAHAMTAQRKADGRVLLVVDYLQIIPAGKDAPDALREKIDWNLTELRRLSRDLGSPVLLISSMNRAAYDANKPPTLAALKESGGIEYSADAVVCLWRNKEESEKLTKDMNRLTERVEAHILKNRSGELARVRLNFTKAWALFTDAGKDSLGYDAALGG